jgi:hypothetical protein
VDVRSFLKKANRKDRITKKSKDGEHWGEGEGRAATVLRTHSCILFPLPRFLLILSLQQQHKIAQHSTSRINQSKRKDNELNPKVKRHRRAKLHQKKGEIKETSSVLEKQAFVGTSKT